jgi:endonuclease/exonuclease/phosphatase family metal-dependent hydrolase
MSYNVRYDTDVDGENAWPHRRDRVVGTIARTDPDVIGLQEPIVHQLEYLETNLPAYSWIGVGRDDGESEGEFVPIGYRTRRFSLVDRGAFWLSERPDEPGSIGWNAACPRVTTWITLELADDTALTVFDTHFDHRSALARHRSAEFLRSKVAVALDSGPVIVTADLNCSESTSPYEVLVGSGSDDGEAVLRDPLAAADHRGPRRTYHEFAGIPLERRDYVLVDPSIAVTSSRTIDERGRERFSSDHFAVVADVSLPNRS